MRPWSLFILLFVLMLVSCSPAALPASTPTAVSTSTPAVVVEDPPPCQGGDLLYHAQLQQMLLVNCVADRGTESPLILWGWDGSRWQKVSEGGPPGRILGAAAYDERRNVLVLYGGRPVELGACSQETWEWDGQTWEQKDVSPPAACDHVKMVYDAARGESILFSGLDPSENPRNETWAWNGENWRRLSQEGPESRGHFGFVYDPNHEQVLLYGGYTNTATDEFWVWRDGTWQEVNFSGPGRLSHFGIAYDIEENAMYLFGGATSGSTFSSLTNTTWVLKDGRWRELNPASAPARRGLPAMGYDPVRQQVVLYGGFDAGRNDLNDTWAWDGENWVCLMNCN